ncbi:MAG: hypothetical protein H6765_07925 [Candidatus Peribacteria bacterium]|nr:MAG: hypothetical protein H6765_07925 [Candidatus Peribacteria bacterium]
MTYLHNDRIEFPEFNLLGLGSHLADEDEVMLIKQLPTNKPRVGLTHNPDTTLLYSGDLWSDYTLVGHTHCGQIRIPYIYKRVLPVE